MGLFDKKYFTKGAESNYIGNNCYLKKKHKKLAKDIIEVCGLNIYDTIFDYGCATGSLVYELQKLKIEAVGTDISKWAIDYGKKKYCIIAPQLMHYNKKALSLGYSFVLFLDVLEHCKTKELNDIFKRLNKIESKILVRIPVSSIEGDDFILKCSKKDKTHIQIHSKTWWRRFFKRKGYEISKIIDEKAIYDSDGVIAWVLKKQF